jgi:hypothetical protein
MSCETCRFKTKKLRKFFKLVDWCALYKRKAEQRCVDYKEKEVGQNT